MVAILRHVLVSFVTEDNQPFSGKHVHLDILGDDEVIYQHYVTDDKGRLTINNRLAKLREGKYDVCITSDPVDDPYMKGYTPFTIDIKRGAAITIPASAVDMRYESVTAMREELEAVRKELEGERARLAERLEQMRRGKEKVLEGRARLAEREEMVEGEFAELKNLAAEAERTVSEHMDLYERITLEKETMDRAKSKILEGKEHLIQEMKQLPEAIKQDLSGYIDDTNRVIAGHREIFEAIMAEKERLMEIYDKMKRLREIPVEDNIREINEKYREMEEKREKFIEARDKLLEGKDHLMAQRGEIAGLLKEEITAFREKQDAILAEKEEILRSARQKILEGKDHLDEERKSIGDVIKSDLQNFIDEQEALLEEKRERLQQASHKIAEGLDRLEQDRANAAEAVKYDLREYISKTEKVIQDHRSIYDAIIEEKEKIKELYIMIKELHEMAPADDLKEIQRQYELVMAEKPRLREARDLILEGRARVEKDRQAVTRKEGAVKKLERYLMMQRETLERIAGEAEIDPSKIPEIRTTREKIEQLITDGEIEVYEEYRKLRLRIESEKDKLRSARDRIELGWKKLRNEYEEKVRDARRKEELERLARERLKEIERDRRASKEMREELLAKRADYQEALRSMTEHETRMEDLKDDEKELRVREALLEREKHKLDRMREAFEREKAQRLEVYKQNDAEIEAELRSLERQRSEIKRIRDQLEDKKDEILVEAQNWRCPVPGCIGVVRVRTKTRPLRTWCSEGHELNLFRPKVYPCLKCGHRIEVKTSVRPILIRCSNCGSEMILKKDISSPRKEEAAPHIRL